MGVMLTRKNEKGNVLFLILIAVVLFAALSYAVSQSNQTSGDISSEEAELAAAEIINYFAAIQGEAQRLNLVHGVPYYNINLGNNNSHGSLTGGSEGVVGNIWADNPNCVDLDKCSVFIERGGNIPSRDFYELAGIPIGNWNGHIVPGEFRGFNNFIEGVGTETEPEILLTVGGLKDEVCDALNDRFGLPPHDSQPLMSAETRGQRNYWNQASDYSNRLPGAATAYIGAEAFCAENASNRYGNIFYYVLHAG